MRVIAVLAAALLLSSCSWLHREFGPPPLPPTPVAKPTPPPPPEVKPHPVAPHVERPVPQVQNSAPVAVPPPPPAPDYNARCREMASNRVTDAKQLGASLADQARIQNDTYKDCMAQSVPALRP